MKGNLTLLLVLIFSGSHLSLAQNPKMPGKVYKENGPLSPNCETGKQNTNPAIPGLPDFNAYLDSDHDGIPNNIDRCPFVAGPADNGGCPIADRDHDGIPDKEDACPDQPGPLWNHGCPASTKQHGKIKSLK